MRFVLTIILAGAVAAVIATIGTHFGVPRIVAVPLAGGAAVFCANVLYGLWKGHNAPRT
jgi:hypothetical protein